jgi:hypothetical protein
MLAAQNYIVALKRHKEIAIEDKVCEERASKRWNGRQETERMRASEKESGG